MAYYNYLALKRPGDSLDDDYNWLVVSPDRNTTDTFFRLLLENRELKLGSKKSTTVTIHEIKRESSRFWTIDSSDRDVGATLHFALSGKNDSSNTAENTVLNDLVGKIKIYWMGGRASQQWKIIGQQATVDVDNDWLSGYSFFIRRRGFPNSYWHMDKGICLSDSKRTRFVVSIRKPTTMAPKIPLIASDQITISTIGPGGELEPLKAPRSGAGTETRFQFGDFLTRFSVDQADGRTIVYTEAGRGDSFELCEGIPYRYDSE
ncbi:hypothetical protein G6O67_006781 [Ophiocordyceps sinensis]|uniref:Uncharacterized protein n=2 Tax=Ophiocordyceps sinensis TaxID=72228 RepID=A0A8H4LX71_9HYPO|nr:hypothetical protein OCS_06583 [Ophiocordyceps sinensis CO18]KAF4506727.1 hypothetical protein G6O67_006781 [Ophiocordyceps sinensis]